jgi:hypothetical protein
VIIRVRCSRSAIIDAARTASAPPPRRHPDATADSQTWQKLIYMLWRLGHNIKYSTIFSVQCPGTDDHMQENGNPPLHGCDLPFGGISMPPFIRGESGASVVAGSMFPSG